LSEFNSNSVEEKWDANCSKGSENLLVSMVMERKEENSEKTQI
jgi:hypothetical protein